jgi:hypothetical protein
MSPKRKKSEVAKDPPPLKGTHIPTEKSLAKRRSGRINLSLKNKRERKRGDSFKAHLLFNVTNETIE